MFGQNRALAELVIELASDRITSLEEEAQEAWKQQNMAVYDRLKAKIAVLTVHRGQLYGDPSCW
jgi:hypothetical protein